jgi:hypothetical protein
MQVIHLSQKELAERWRMSIHHGIVLVACVVTGCHDEHKTQQCKDQNFACDELKNLNT